MSPSLLTRDSTSMTKGEDLKQKQVEVMYTYLLSQGYVGANKCKRLYGVAWICLGSLNSIDQKANDFSLSFVNKTVTNLKQLLYRFIIVYIFHRHTIFLQLISMYGFYKDSKMWFQCRVYRNHSRKKKDFLDVWIMYGYLKI